MQDIFDDITQTFVRHTDDWFAKPSRSWSPMPVGVANNPMEYLALLELAFQFCYDGKDYNSAYKHARIILEHPAADTNPTICYFMANVLTREAKSNDAMHL
uniref:Uncharacterized protein n=1 Tax=Cyclophora tenuis TaxID=216820 RepID=A0A7S1D4D3_CYCTE|mmetsp:Transcript_22656/g.38522  ORF Transcript_22656/g.38522 Transcript_22656/m.38522 type:complete len:101 (+) Transcript_22656:269-571(+)